MASITVRNLDSEVKSRLRIRAAEHGRSFDGRGSAGDLAPSSQFGSQAPELG